MEAPPKHPVTNPRAQSPPPPDFFLGGGRVGGVRDGGALLVGTGGEERTRLLWTPPPVVGGEVRVGPVERCGVTERGGLIVRPVITEPRGFTLR